MALLNRPITEDEARKMIADWRRSLYGAPIKTFYDMYLAAIADPTPHVVRYNAAFNNVTYVPPASFYWGQGRKSVSDCLWIVPGTHEKEL